jgi:hypothetical protein
MTLLTSSWCNHSGDGDGMVGPTEVTGTYPSPRSVATVVICDQG